MFEDKITVLKCFNYRSGGPFLSVSDHAIQILIVSAQFLQQHRLCTDWQPRLGALQVVQQY